MPDREDLERRLYRTMRWDADVMVPTPERDAEDELTERNKKDGEDG